MSPTSRSSPARDVAVVFTALGDPVRLILLTRLRKRGSCSIGELTTGFKISRQAVSKHLQALSKAGLVKGQKAGRENRYALQKSGFDLARSYLDRAAQQWDQALMRLEAHIANDKRGE